MRYPLVPIPSWELPRRYLLNGQVAQDPPLNLYVCEQCIEERNSTFKYAYVPIKKLEYCYPSRCESLYCPNRKTHVIINFPRVYS